MGNLRIVKNSEDLAMLVSSTDASSVPEFNASHTNNTVIFDRGHKKDADPGAVVYNDDGTLTKETDVIEVLFNLIASVFVGKGMTFSFTKWDFINAIIAILNNIFSKTKSSTLVSLHSDTVQNVNSYPLTLGIYYGSESGRELSELIISTALEIAAKKKVKLRTWIKPHTASPRKRLGLIKFTQHRAIIVESDFVGRPPKERAVVDSIIAESLAIVFKDSKKKNSIAL